MPLNLYERVKEQAKIKDRSIPGYIRQVLKRYLWYVENEPEALTGEWEIR
ncbi:MAG: hypothetical protein HFF52_08860 [Lawsonibacter sp.]|nr:hypothetical protein [Lawsonibacter sp.]